MNDSETRGWKSGGRACGCWKKIRGVRYEIAEGVDSFTMWCTKNSYSTLISSYPTLPDAKRAAHAHARETK